MFNGWPMWAIVLVALLAGCATGIVLMLGLIQYLWARVLDALDNAPTEEKF